MTPERFRQLTEAYGARPEHWPAAERTAAQALIARRDPETLAALARAGSLDMLLSTHAVAAPGTGLIQRVMASSPLEMSLLKPAWKKPNWWLSGAGFVGVGVAGIAAGALVISLTASLVSTPGGPSLFDQTGESTVFSTNTSDWSDQ